MASNRVILVNFKHTNVFSAFVYIFSAISDHRNTWWRLNWTKVDLQQPMRISRSKTTDVTACTLGESQSKQCTQIFCLKEADIMAKADDITSSASLDNLSEFTAKYSINQLQWSFLVMFVHNLGEYFGIQVSIYAFWCVFSWVVWSTKKKLLLHRKLRQLSLITE